MIGINLILYCGVEYTEIQSKLRSINISMYSNIDTELNSHYLQRTIVLFSRQTYVVTYNAGIKNAKNINNSFCSQSGFPAATFGECSWQWLLAQAPTAASICRGSALRWLPLPNSRAGDWLSSLEGHLLPSFFAWCLDPALVVPFLGAARSRIHTRVLWAVTE